MLGGKPTPGRSRFSSCIIRANSSFWEATAPPVDGYELLCSGVLPPQLCPAQEILSILHLWLDPGLRTPPHLCSLVCLILYTGHPRITYYSSSFKSWINLRTVWAYIPLFTQLTEDSLKLPCIILHLESLTWNHSDGWGWDFKDPCSLFWSRTNMKILFVLIAP